MKLTAATTIHCDLATLRKHALEPRQQVRWDLRFTTIDPGPGDATQTMFSYATRMCGVSVCGWGRAQQTRAGRGTALHFGSNDGKSLIHHGRGTWAFISAGDRTHFATVYDYVTRHGLIGRLIDALVFRPLMIWATRWSFDRLRLWIEKQLAPEISVRLWLVKVFARACAAAVWFLEGLIPKCLAIRPDEVNLVTRSGLFVHSPRATLLALGVAEMLAGLWLLTGRAERTSIGLATLATLALTAVVTVTDPTHLADPMGGLVKGLALVACGVTVWTLAPLTPNARRGNERRLP
jgi:hypothetical protein